MSTKELIDSAVAHLRTSASVKQVYGEPIVIDGKTIIPVAKIGVTKSGAKKSEPRTTGKAPVAAAPAEVAGGAVSAQPVGVVEIDGTDTKFVPVGQTRKLTLAASIGAGVGFVLGAVLGRRGEG